MMNKDKKIFYIQWWFWLSVAATILVATPFIINYAYLKGTADGLPNTVFSASDIILFYGSILSFIGTVTLGSLAFYQNKKLNKINENLSKENNYFQKINAQSLLPVIKIVDVVIGQTTFCARNSTSITAPMERYYFSKSHNKINSVHTGETVELKNNYITLNIDIDNEKDYEIQQYCKVVNFKLANTSQAIIRHIAFDRIEIVGIKTDTVSVEQAVCFNQNHPKAGISTLLNQHEDELFCMFIYFKNETYKDFWEKPLGGLCFRLYITNTTITGISFKQYITVSVNNENISECSYGHENELKFEED